MSHQKWGANSSFFTFGVPPENCSIKHRINYNVHKCTRHVTAYCHVMKESCVMELPSSEFLTIWPGYYVWPFDLRWLGIRILYILVMTTKFHTNKIMEGHTRIFLVDLSWNYAVWPCAAEGLRFIYSKTEFFPNLIFLTKVGIESVILYNYFQNFLWNPAGKVIGHKH